MLFNYSAVRKYGCLNNHITSFFYFVLAMNQLNTFSMSYFVIHIGTIIETWSSPDALSHCNHSEKPIEEDNDPDTQRLLTKFMLDHPEEVSSSKKITLPSNFNEDSAYWNAMIYPLLRSTIKGVIWYALFYKDSHVYGYCYLTLFTTLFSILIYLTPFLQYFLKAGKYLRLSDSSIFE
jgi:hypothetical protein